MYRTCLLIGLLLLTGCESIKGPRAPRDDGYNSRGLSLDEQQQRGRESLAYPDSSSVAGPRMDGLTMPGQQGR